MDVEVEVPDERFGPPYRWRAVMSKVAVVAPGEALVSVAMRLKGRSGAFTALVTGRRGDRDAVASSTVSGWGHGAHLGGMVRTV
jgi:hypothetical protein